MTAANATQKTRTVHRPCKTVQRPCSLRIKRKSHEESYDSSLDFGALEGTRIPGPLIKRIRGASFVKAKKHEEAQIHSHYRKIHICTHRIICIQRNALQLLSSCSGVQKCADRQNKAQWTNQPPVLWQGLGHPNRHRFTSK